MASLVAQRHSRTLYLADGASTSWNFNFAGGYIDKSHVKVEVTEVGGLPTNRPITAADFIGPYQLLLSPPVANGALLAIYRDTPKDLPLVDFTDGSGLSEAAMDVNAKQAVFIAAEVADGYAVADVNAAIAAAAQATAAAAAATTAATQAQIALGSLLGENTRVRLSGTGTQTTFSLTEPTDSARVIVFVQGIYQHSATYTLGFGAITFTTPPPAGAENIEVVINTALPMGSKLDATNPVYTGSLTGGSGIVNFGGQFVKDGEGNVILTANPTAATLVTNNTLTLSAAGNTAVRVSLRGTDGVTRSGTIPLT